MSAERRPRATTKSEANGYALHDSSPPPAPPARKPTSQSNARPNPYSPEAKKRRVKLIAEINAGWSEESERALSILADRLEKRVESHPRHIGVGLKAG